MQLHEFLSHIKVGYTNIPHPTLSSHAGDDFSIDLKKLLINCLSIV